MYSAVYFHRVTRVTEVMLSRAVERSEDSLPNPEDKDSPLSDLEIANLLKEQNISIARRTVAKYRESMHIPSVKRRKK